MVSVMVHRNDDVDDVDGISIVRSVVRFGRQRLYLWPDREGDGTVNSQTPPTCGPLGGLGRLEHV